MKKKHNKHIKKNTNRSKKTSKNDGCGGKESNNNTQCPSINQGDIVDHFENDKNEIVHNELMNSVPVSDCNFVDENNDECINSTCNTRNFAESFESKIVSEGNSIASKEKEYQCPPQQLQQQPEAKRRRSTRNTNQVAFSNRNSLQYKRLHDLFFNESCLRVQPQQHKQQSTSFSLLSSSSSRLRTFLKDGENGDSFFLINNLRLYPVCCAPNIYTIPNFLTESELQHLQNKINKGRFQRSFVDQGKLLEGKSSAATSALAAVATAVSTHTGLNKRKSSSRIGATLYDDEHRTSAFLSFQKQEDKKIQSIEQKAAELFGYFTPTIAVEPLQLVRYLPGQFFGLHHDLGDYNPETGHVTLPPKTCLFPRRLVTIFVYLNECCSGGATHFPQARDFSCDGVGSSKRNLRVYPTVPGTAVVFCNVLENGQPDPRTVHEGERVGEGCVKYGLNIWLCEA